MTHQVTGLSSSGTVANLLHMASTQAITLGQKLQEARERWGWSIHRTAQEMGIPRQVLWTLEGNNKDKEPPSGGDMQLKTVLRILRVAYPDVQLTDFLPETDLKVVKK